jgi:hypothetical protein
MILYRKKELEETILELPNELEQESKEVDGQKTVTLKSVIDYAYGHKELKSLRVYISQLPANKIAVVTAECEAFIKASSFGEGRTVRQAELNAKVNLLREITGIDFICYEEVYKNATASNKTQLPRANVNVPMPPTKSAKEAPRKPVVDSGWDKKDVVTMKVFRHILGIAKNSECDKYVVEWSAGTWKTFKDINPENIKAFNVYLKKKAAETASKEEIDAALKNAFKEAGID